MPRTCSSWTRTHLEVVKLVVDVKAQVLDPLPRAIELVREAHDEERVERVDEEAVAARGELGFLKPQMCAAYYPIGPLGLMLDPRWLIG